MGLIEIASGNSVWRGMDYYENHKVVSWNKSGNSTYEGVVSGSNGDSYNVYIDKLEGVVSGSNGDSYNVYIDKLHPRKSICNCAFAKGRRVVCKHMIALYFTAEPDATCQERSNQKLIFS